jgi:hypothetical protein
LLAQLPIHGQYLQDGPGSSTSTSINATAGTSGGNISVTANNSCGSSNARIITVNILDCQFLSGQTGPGGVGNESDNQIWLDAGTLSQSNGSSVNRWPDISGNDNSAAQSTSSRRPTYSINSINEKPAINFNGSSQFLQTSSISALNVKDISWFIVGRTNTLDKTQNLIRSSYSSGAGTNSSTLWGTLYWTGSGNFHTHASTESGSQIGIQYSPSTSYSIHSTVWSGSTGNLEGFLDGNIIGTRTGINANPTGHQFTRIGAVTTSIYNSLDGSIAEIIVFNRALNITQRRIVENYLSSKYALPISGDLYSFDAPGGHGHQVAGIGQTSISDNHTAARGTGIVEISSPSDLGDGEFLLIGHNNNDLTQNTSDIPSAYNGGFRYNRTWRAGHTGNVGTVTLRFDLSGLSYSSDNFELLISANGTFSSATRHTSGISFNPATGILTFTGVTLANGTWFTVGASGGGSSNNIVLANNLPAKTFESETETELSVLNMKSNSSFTLYPNPIFAGNNLYLKVNLPVTEGILNIKIYDLVGKVVYQQNQPLDQYEQKVLLNYNMPRGIYIITAETGDFRFSERVIIQ